jgi:hypothetical protein
MAQAKKSCHHLGPLKILFSTEIKKGYLKAFSRKIYMCDKGDKITRFDEFL